MTYCTWLIYILIWITLYAIAIELSFGIVFFMLSLLLGICFNTRVRPRNARNEVSAYSVFNANCEAIDGTFKAEMFEKQLGLRQLWNNNNKKNPFYIYLLCLSLLHHHNNPLNVSQTIRFCYNNIYFLCFIVHQVHNIKI